MQNGEDKAFSKNPAGERRHGEAVGEDKLPTVQRYNSQERQKREEDSILKVLKDSGSCFKFRKGKRMASE